MCTVPIVASSRERETSEQLRRGRGRAAEDDTATPREESTLNVYGSLPRTCNLSIFHTATSVYLLIFTYTAEFESSKKNNVAVSVSVSGDDVGAVSGSVRRDGARWAGDHSRTGVGSGDGGGSGMGSADGDWASVGSGEGGTVGMGSGQMDAVSVGSADDHAVVSVSGQDVSVVSRSDGDESVVSVISEHYAAVSVVSVVQDGVVGESVHAVHERVSIVVAYMRDDEGEKKQAKRTNVNYSLWKTSFVLYFIYYIVLYKLAESHEKMYFYIHNDNVSYIEESRISIESI
ncbi:unnamed protein product [Trichogramma brassicae]|uniref:Uncharacterized protein n=1 Tax=Trichogramma brassicae TaxID=86971 RepID=A0A6H5IEU8_9HYME|nr:unnamed protein product [Trichogramma brassicae]